MGREPIAFEGDVVAVNIDFDVAGPLGGQSDGGAIGELVARIGSFSGSLIGGVSRVGRFTGCCGAVDNSDSLEFVEVASPVEDIYLTELEWAADGETILTTHIDRIGEDEVLGIAEVAVDTGAITTLVTDGITPAVAGADLYYLTVGDDSARHSVSLLDSSGAKSVVAFEGSNLDLDHLVAGVETGEVFVTVLDIPDAGGVTVGDEAEAHGNHDVLGTWWDTAVRTSEPVMQAYDPIIVYNATMTDDAIVYATLTGLSVAPLDGDERLTLIESRAIRFVAG